MRPSTLVACLRTLVAILRPVFIWGPPGIGKSQLVAQVAHDFTDEEDRAHPFGSRWYLRDQRGPTMDPVDLRGMPDLADGRTTWRTPDWWPTNADVKAGRAPRKGIIFFDELSAAPMAVQVAMYQMILDRTSPSGAVLADGWAIIAAGNRVQDGAAAGRMSSALLNRMTHLDLTPDVDDWGRWALENGILPELVAFSRFRPNLFVGADAPKAGVRAFPTPRSWAAVSAILDQRPPREAELALIQGTVGEGEGTEFYTFLDLYRKVPSVDGIILNPDKADVPKEPATRYAVVFALAHKMTKASIGPIVRYLDRCPEEYAVLAMKAATVRDKELTKTREFTGWAVKHQSAILG